LEDFRVPLDRAFCTSIWRPLEATHVNRPLSKVLKLLVISDFNLQNLASLLTNSTGAPRVEAKTAPFDQVMQTLLADSFEVWPRDMAAAIVWTSPQSVSNAYARMLDYQPASADELAAEVQTFARVLVGVPAHVKQLFVPTWTARHFLEDRRVLLDLDPSLGVSAALMRMNLALSDAVRGDPRIHLFDASRWISAYGERAYDPRLWYLSKTPFSLDVFKAATADFLAALRGLGGNARKLLILDLDDTLWGGILGDLGADNLRLGGHDAVGEAFRDFQRALKALSNRGVMLAIASKNEEGTALDALSSHPEMILRPADFVGWRINWDDKARNIAGLIDDLNLKPESAVFIDDSPVERARVREALPAILVPEWPNNPLHFSSALRRLDCFDAPFISSEDRKRTAMYASERDRRRLRDETPTVEGWLQTLGITVVAEPLGAVNLERTVQLLNKTNQMNLRTRRCSAAELAQWAAAPGNHLIVFRVSDKFGDYGLVGIAGFHHDAGGEIAEISDFVLSCRVMGRKVEETMLHALARRSRARGASILSATYLATAMNAPCRRFFEASGMAQVHPGFFQLNLGKNYPCPACINLQWAQELAALSAPIVDERADVISES
jgi:FkbH-like protein